MHGSSPSIVAQETRAATRKCFSLSWPVKITMTPFVGSSISSSEVVQNTTASPFICKTRCPITPLISYSPETVVVRTPWGKGSISTFEYGILMC